MSSYPLASPSLELIVEVGEVDEDERVGGGGGGQPPPHPLHHHHQLLVPHRLPPTQQP